MVILEERDLNSQVRWSSVGSLLSLFRFNDVLVWRNLTQRLPRRLLRSSSFDRITPEHSSNLVVLASESAW
jgi:hypothetical protein